MILVAVSLIFAVLIALADQIIKVWVLNNLTFGQTKDFIIIESEKVIGLTLHFNDGAVFGSLSGMRILLIIMPIAIIAICLWAMFKKKITKPFPLILMGGIIGGGIGNLIDRIFRGGKVVDYLDVQLFDFAIFNFADCFITVGCILLAIYLLFFDDEIFADEHKVINEADNISVTSISSDTINNDSNE